MNAQQFIKDHGLEKAREVVEGAPDWAKSYYDPTLQYQDQEWVDEISVSISQLKRLVESVDRINASGGIYGFKTYCNGDYQEQDFEDIRNYESIYGEGNE